MGWGEVVKWSALIVLRRKKATFITVKFNLDGFMKRYNTLSTLSRMAMGSIFIAAIVCMFACDDSSSAPADAKDESVVQSSSSIKFSSSSSKKAKSSSSNVSSSSLTPRAVDPATIVMGKMTDSRDGKKYKTVTIGDQTWMAENINYETENSYCYNESAEYCAKYGRLYTWDAAMDNACPEGWHLPDTTEWSSLFKAVACDSIVGDRLDPASGLREGCDGSWNGAFLALPAGSMSYVGFYDAEGDYAYFWSSIKRKDSYAYHVVLDFDYNMAFLDRYFDYVGLSVRCVKD